MNRLCLWIKTALFYGVGFLISLFFSLLMLPFTFLPEKTRRDNRFYFWLGKIWSVGLVKLSFIRYHVKNSENLPTYPNEPAIILINHSSALDIPLVEVLLQGYPHIWLSKHEYRNIPLLGILLRRMHLLIDRNDPSKQLRLIKQACSLAKENARHLVLFPEGTRHEDGQIHDFFEGFATFSQHLKRPVIPIVIAGLNKICPKHSLMIDSSKCLVKISVGKPMYADGKTRQEFVNEVRGWFVREMAKFNA
ncbi:1-acyl-sn-glycerol-3-phosphate acyltransferase [Candidatus Babeliales bacterium]|nr:1-acyl-sn-glycerol-3-phosphate acyltransferase [Candidatus Babeliales bacterium]